MCDYLYIASDSMSGHTGQVHRVSPPALLAVRAGSLLVVLVILAVIHGLLATLR